MIRNCIELHSEMTGNKGRSRHRSGGIIQRMKRRKGRNSGKEYRDNVRRQYEDRHENGYANGNGAEGFAQHMELDDEQEQSGDVYQHNYNADASDGHGDGHGDGANWDRMDMEDGGSGDDGDSHGVSIVSATNGRKQKKKDNDNDGNGFVENDDDEDGEDVDGSPDASGGEGDGSSSNEDPDDEMNDEESNIGNSESKKSDDRSKLQAKYNAMMQLTIQYGQELKSEFDGDPRREVKQALEETFALIAYPDARESMLAPLLDVGERVPVAEELNAAILGKHYLFV